MCINQQKKIKEEENELRRWCKEVENRIKGQ